MATSRLASALALLLLCCLTRTALATKQQPSIQHVVVLVMENRAFDHMVGMKATTNVRIDGCPLHTTSPACGNRLDPSNKTMPFVFVDDQAVYVQPADPQHSILASNEQLFGTSVPQGPEVRFFESVGHPSIFFLLPIQCLSTTHLIHMFYPIIIISSSFSIVHQATPLMDGFASSYAAQNPASQGGGGFIMKCFAPAHVPVLSTLIDEFALFNSWHSSVPGPTMVNRAFFDATTSRGASKNDVLDIILGYPQRTIYEDLDEAGATWRVYFQQIATSWQMKYTRTKLQVRVCMC
jgi:phospholipase C